MPKVSVVMAVHNGGAYLKEATESILRQSLRDFELIVVDDGSSDESAALLEAFGDARIRILRNQQQLGLSASLNRGADTASGDYIARMDADDVSLPARLAAQVAFLDRHPEVSIVGCWARTIGERPPQTWRYPTADADIRCAFLFHSVLVHSAVMWRRPDFEGHGLRYDEGVERAQDYELWTRAAEHVCFANLPRVLQHYRLHPDQVGRQQTGAQQAVADTVRVRELQALGIDSNPAELELHHDLARAHYPPGEAGLDKVEAWFNKLLAANQVSQRYPAEALKRTLGRHWLLACRRVVRQLGMVAWRRYRSSSLSWGFYLELWLKARLAELRGAQ